MAAPECLRDYRALDMLLQRIFKTTETTEATDAFETTERSNWLRSHRSKLLIIITVSVSLCLDTLCADALYFVHGYAQVHTSIYIYISLFPIFLGGPMGPIHPVWGHVLVTYSCALLA